MLLFVGWNTLRGFSPSRSRVFLRGNAFPDALRHEPAYILNRVFSFINQAF